MTKPVRIQLSRKRGFNLQEYSHSLNGLQAIVVSRPSKWGNPFKLMGDMIYLNAGYRRKIISPYIYVCGGDDELCLHLFKCVVTGNFEQEDYDIAATNIPDFDYWIQHFKKLDFSELKNKNLACWCNEKFKYCHSDFLIKLANKK